MKTFLEPPQPDLRNWASKQLGVSLEASPREARTALMRKLAEHNFLPPPALQEGCEYLAGAGAKKPLPSMAEQALFDEETLLRAQVEEFAGEFFSLAPGKRRLRFNTLLDQCAWSPPLRARLERLDAGLNLESPRLAGPSTRQALADHLCQLFVLSPRDRAQRIGNILSNCQSDWSAWEEAARHCQKHLPHLAALEPYLVDELAWSKMRRARSKPRLPRPATVPVPGAPSSGGGHQWGLWVILFVLLTMVRLFTAGPSSTRAPNPPAFNQFQPKLDKDFFQGKDILEELKKNPERFGEATKRIFGVDQPKKLLPATKKDAPQLKIPLPPEEPRRP